MSNFQSGDKVRAPHPQDPVSGVLHPGTVTGTRNVTVGPEGHELVAIDYDDGASAEVAADSVEHA